MDDSYGFSETKLEARNRILERDYEELKQNYNELLEIHNSTKRILNDVKADVDAEQLKVQTLQYDLNNLRTITATEQRSYREDIQRLTTANNDLNRQLANAIEQGEQLKVQLQQRGGNGGGENQSELQFRFEQLQLEKNEMEQQLQTQIKTLKNSIERLTDKNEKLEDELKDQLGKTSSNYKKQPHYKYQQQKQQFPQYQQQNLQKQQQLQYKQQLNHPLKDCYLHNNPNECGIDEHCIWNDDTCWQNYRNPYESGPCVNGNMYYKNYSKSAKSKSRSRSLKRGSIRTGSRGGKYRIYSCKEGSVPKKICTKDDYNNVYCSYDPIDKKYRPIPKSSPRRSR